MMIAPKLFFLRYLITKSAAVLCVNGVPVFGSFIEQ
jgi:hypothetical protein